MDPITSTVTSTNSPAADSAASPGMTGGPLSWLFAWLATGWTGWNRFWFTPRRPTTLGVIRIATGLIALYSQLVWTLEFDTFFSEQGLLPNEYRQLFFGVYTWSHFDFVQSPALLKLIHWAGLGVVILFTAGLFTRVTSILTTLILISYINRATGALFGLDQILVLLCLYLSLGNSGGAFSMDRMIRRWREKKGESGHSSLTAGNAQSREGQGGKGWLGTGGGAEAPADVLTNIAIRLIQLHLCLIYFYAGLGKLQGETWWNGQAIWFTVASYEYQTLDLSWMAQHMELVAILTLVTVYWEVTYPALIWYRWTRPVMLAIALLTHLGIGIAMGMLTFGLIMIVANLSFVEFNRNKKLVMSNSSADPGSRN
jgi:uncharacterized membrane protein YphA (DoxX/SURF4 family)